MFKRVYLEISNRCNLQCSFCPVVERDSQIIKPEAFEKILRQVHPLAQEVFLHLMGEPLFHPQFDEIMRICETYQTPIQITSNGLLLAKHLESLMKRSCLRQINFSIQSYLDHFPERPIAAYLDPLIQFCHRAATERPELYINFRLWNLGRPDASSGLNEAVFLSLEKAFGVSIPRQVRVEKIKSKKLWGRVYLHFDSHFEWPSWDLPFQGTKGRCHGLISHIGIHADGTVVPCCLDKEAQIPLGNCLESDLVTILNTERPKAMKAGFERGKLVESFCQHCSYIRRFSKV